VIACIEIKTTNNPRVSRGFYESINDLHCEHNFVVTPHQEFTYKIKKKSVVCGLVDFLSVYLPEIIS
jgi:uncharacterized protein